MLAGRRATLRRMAWRRWLRWLPPLLGLALLGVALLVLNRELHRLGWQELQAQIVAVPGWALVTAAFATVASYFFLSQYDVLSLRYVGAPVPYHKGTLAGFLSYAFAHGVGMTVFSGAPLRFRLYTAWGMSAVDIATLLAFNSLNFWLGMVTAAGLSFTLAGGVVPSGLHLPVGPLRPLGALLLLAPVGYLAVCVLRRKPLAVGRWQLQVPPPRLAMSQLAVACMDWTAASAVLYALLPADARGHFVHFVTVFILAQVAGLVSQVPGGLGVFESVVVLLLRGSAAQEQALASLVVYRVVYYLVPLGAAALLLLAYEVRQRREDVGRAVRRVSDWLPVVAPYLLAVLSFAGGAVLVVCGSLPSAPRLLGWLGGTASLVLLEVLQVAGSVAGLGLVVVSWGLRRRLEGAWVAASGLLAAGIAAVGLRGLHPGVAVFLALMLVALLPARRFFYRRTRLRSDPMSGMWTVAVGMVVAASVWVGVFVHRDVDWSVELWWQVAPLGDASRALRAGLAVAIGLATMGVARLLGSALREAAPGPETEARVRGVVARSPAASARLALLGDKRFLFGDGGDAFVMYGTQGRSWVAMGDPVGPPGEHRELIWRFNSLVERRGGWTVFHEIGETNLPVYVDLGLTVLPIGEEARVDLGRFDLDGEAAEEVAAAVRRLERDGCSLDVLSGASVLEVAADLAAVSDVWLDGKGARERGFTSGWFDRTSLHETPVAVLWRGGRVVAFANLWLGAPAGELSVDLVRHLPEAPAGVLDGLFALLMQWGKERGCSVFSLGVAPVSSLGSGQFAPLWDPLAGLLCRFGNHFLDVQALRRFQDRFHPERQPRYLVCPGGGALPGVLTDLAALISGRTAGRARTHDGQGERARSIR